MPCEFWSNPAGNLLAKTLVSDGDSSSPGRLDSTADTIASPVREELFPR
jgi:hypothetical protein